MSHASACKLRFRRKTGRIWPRFTLEAEPRSLYMMAGEQASIRSRVFRTFLIFDQVCPSLDMEKYRAMSDNAPTEGSFSALKSGSVIRLGRTPPNQAFEMMVDGSIAFAGRLPHVDGIQHLDVPPPIRDQTRFLQRPGNKGEAGPLHA
jgi:hypothetical protein